LVDGTERYDLHTRYPDYFAVHWHEHDSLSIMLLIGRAGRDQPRQPRSLSQSQHACQAQKAAWDDSYMRQLLVG
jgi:hypothetical protein